MKKSFATILVLFLVIFASFSLAQDNIWYTTILKENFLDKNGQPLTGKGVVVGDVDSGIDIFHPFFFFADGGEYGWIDVNGDGVFTPGIDVVDINRNGIADPNATLNFVKAVNNTYRLKFEGKDFDPALDFLYLDKNHNGKRDFGEKDGFSENDPTYGEQLYIAIDANGNGKLDPGEKIIALKTSKVRAIREKNGTIRRRGIDLIKSEPDEVRHGTSVSGIILGGHKGVERMCGIAPDAEIVMANIKYDYTPRFARQFPEMVQFLRDEKVNVLLFEDGEWIYEFMDGSTAEEELTNLMAREGVTVIGGGGNLASGNMHIKDELAKGQTATYTFKSPASGDSKKNDGVYISFLWTNSKAKPVFTLEVPGGVKSPELKDGSGFIRIGNYNLFYSRDISKKGTALFRFGISEKDSGAVAGDWKIYVTTPDKISLEGFLVDVTQSWGGTTHWTCQDKITGETTVTFPSTADSCIAVGAYTVNIAWGPQDKIGALCNYSGRGYNINGKMGIDISAPGHSTFTCGPEYSYTLFSGTSSAAPHVTGTAVLLLQYDPSLTHSQIRNILHATATSDEFTGALPNTNWGWGKLNPESAIKYLMNVGK